MPGQYTNNSDAFRYANPNPQRAVYDEPRIIQQNQQQMPEHSTSHQPPQYQHYIPQNDDDTSDDTNDDNDRMDQTEQSH